MYVLVAAQYGSWDGMPQLCTMTQGDQHWDVVDVPKLGHCSLLAQSTPNLLSAPILLHARSYREQV